MSNSRWQINMAAAQKLVVETIGIEKRPYHFVWAGFLAAMDAAVVGALIFGDASPKQQRTSEQMVVGFVAVLFLAFLVIGTRFIYGLRFEDRRRHWLLLAAALSGVGLAFREGSASTGSRFQSLAEYVPNVGLGLMCAGVVVGLVLMFTESETGPQLDVYRASRLGVWINTRHQRSVIIGSLGSALAFLSAISIGRNVDALAEGHDGDGLLGVLGFAVAFTLIWTIVLLSLQACGGATEVVSPALLGAAIGFFGSASLLHSELYRSIVLNVGSSCVVSSFASVALSGLRKVREEGPHEPESGQPVNDVPGYL